MQDNFNAPNYMGGLHKRLKQISEEKKKQMDLQKRQVDAAKGFRERLPQLQAELGGQVKSDVNRGMQGNLRAARETTSSRGLLYGGLNQSAEQGVRQNAQREAMMGISNLNAGLEEAAQGLESGAIRAGLGWQNQQQQIQNTIYQNAMARMNGQNQMIGSVIGTGLLIGMTGGAGG